jgi:hypothetical protein
MRFNLLLAVAAFAASPVLAQNAPAAPAAPAAEVPDSEVPKHSCTKPGEFPGSLASERQQREYQKEFVVYTDCLKKFALDQQRLAQPHAKAANAAADEYNNAVKVYNAEVEKLKASAKQ